MTNELDMTMAALSDSTRRAILKRLSIGEARITELAKPFNLSLNAVSKHIRVLERAKLVRRRRSGREHRLSLNPAPFVEAVDWLEQYRQFWEKRFDSLENYLQDLQQKEGEDDVIG